MKVIATTRTLNEEKNVGRFIESYDWVDEVLIVDGGSDDNTVSIVNDYNYAYVRTFHERVEMDNGYWRNPQGKHINTCIDWAIEREADWIIFDDCDCFVNYKLRMDARELLLDCKEDFILVTRIYIYGEDRHFENLAKPSGDWTPSLWAWKADQNFRAKKDDPLKHEFTKKMNEVNALKLMPPYCLLHCFYPDEETMDRKLKKYKESGQHPTILNPKDHVGALISDLPEWAKY